MKQDTSVWTTFFLAVAAALALTFLLSGCASSGPERAPKAVQDEWGFFDPEQCGFSALLAKLEEITDPPEESDARRPS